jgi:hypothetical protein
MQPCFGVIILAGEAEVVLNSGGGVYLGFTEGLILGAPHDCTARGCYLLGCAEVVIVIEVMLSTLLHEEGVRGPCGVKGVAV